MVCLHINFEEKYKECVHHNILYMIVHVCEAIITLLDSREIQVTGIGAVEAETEVHVCKDEGCRGPA